MYSKNKKSYLFQIDVRGQSTTINLDFSSAAPKLREIGIKGKIDSWPFDPLVGHNYLMNIYLIANNFNTVPNNALENFPHLLNLNLEDTVIENLGENSLFVRDTGMNPNNFFNVVLENTCLHTLPDELFGPAGQRKKMKSLSLNRNQLVELKENTFKDFLFGSAIYESEFVLSAEDNPFSCCSLSWMYLEGLKYGQVYKDQVTGVRCGITEGISDEYSLWDMACADFILCQTEDGLDNFVADCEATDPEPLPNTTTAATLTDTTQKNSSRKLYQSIDFLVLFFVFYCI